jgi:acetyl-CoA carboxylase carboxyl transferase subunit alpha
VVDKPDRTDERQRKQRARARLKRIRALKKAKEAAAEIPVAKSAAPAVKSVVSAATTMPDESTERNKERQRAIDALERDVAELSRLTNPTDETASEIERLRSEVSELKREFYQHLGAWQRVQLARHPQRPYTEDYIRILFEGFSEIHGDRRFADDAALISGFAWFRGKPVLVVGSQKGRDTKQRVERNFGQAKPEGYRKALRAMELAAKFHRPIVVFVDTQGAYPGIGAEERGQAEAIAYNLREMSRLPVPIVVTITGEGGSGGALAIAIGDRVFMLENSVYSVISPEGCASIMWRDASKAEIAAEALKMTAQDLLNLQLIDEIVPEPEGGAHFDHEAAARLLEPVLDCALNDLSSLSTAELLNRRYEKYRRMGQFFA